MKLPAGIKVYTGGRQVFKSEVPDKLIKKGQKKAIEKAIKSAEAAGKATQTEKKDPPKGDK